ncbi:MAG: SoxR reducing system RseC family protein [Candidatus Heteroscillospira sp.]
MTQEATVTRLLPGGMAEIAVRRESACGGNCHACGGTCSFKNLMKVSAKNSVMAEVGSRVVVESSTASILKAAAVVYVIPLVLFFAFYAIAAVMGAGETASVCASLAGFLIGVGGAVMLNRSLKNRAAATFEIVSILQN